MNNLFKLADKLDKKHKATQNIINWFNTINPKFVTKKLINDIQNNLNKLPVDKISISAQANNVIMEVDIIFSKNGGDDGIADIFLKSIKFV